MLLVIGTALGFLLAGSAFLVVRGLVGLFRWRRKAAALRLLGGVVLFAVTVLLLGGASYLLGSRKLGEGATVATEKARVLAANISTHHFIGMSGRGYEIGLAVASYEWIAAIALVLYG